MASSFNAEYSKTVGFTSLDSSPSSADLSDHASPDASTSNGRLFRISTDPLYVLDLPGAADNTAPSKDLFDDTLFQRYFQMHFVDKNVAPIAFLGFDQQTHPVLICVASNNSIFMSFPEASPTLSSSQDIIDDSDNLSSPIPSTSLSSFSSIHKEFSKFHKPIPVLVRSCHFRPLTMCDQWMNLFAPSKTLSSRKSLKSLLRSTFPELLTGSRLFPLPENNPSLVPDILRLEEKLIISGAKFGFVYCQPDQQTEDEMLSNQTSSPQFEQFLSLIGEKVDLTSHTGYRGDLDVSGANTAGVHSYISSHHGIEMMFHVSTLLPHTEGDPQQVSKKKYIGNDVVVVIFQDAMPEGKLLDPVTFRSQFNHVFIAVAALEISGVPHYHVECSYKLGVLPHPPSLPPHSLFPVATPAERDHFKDWFLTKLINSTRAALHAPGFKGSLIRTRRQLFAEHLTDKYYDGPKPKAWKLATSHHASPKPMRASSGTPVNREPSVPELSSLQRDPVSGSKTGFLSRVRSFDAERFQTVKKGFSLTKKLKQGSSHKALPIPNFSRETIREDDPSPEHSPSGLTSSPLRKPHPRLEALSSPSPPSSPSRTRSSTVGSSSSPPPFKLASSHQLPLV